MNCKGCHYRRLFGNGSSGTACHYMLDTGLPRVASAEDCYRYKIHYRPKGKIDKSVPVVGRTTNRGVRIG